MISNSSDRNLYFDPVSGCMRFDVDFDIPSHIPKAISWPMDAQRENKHYGFKNLTLALTMRCNMACDYCWQYRSDIPDMDKATISKWLDFFLDPVNNQPNKILYYGGEPLLRMDLIQFAASQMRKLCAERGMAPVKQHIFTNGTLLTDANLDILQTENVFLILSVDGAPQLNRLHRHLAGGEAVDDLIAAGIRRMHARTMKFGVCCTLSKADFDAEQSIAYILREIRPNSIELNLRHDAAFCKEAERYSGQLLPSFWNAWNMIANSAATNIDLCKRVSAIANRIPLQNSSSGSKNKLAVMPNGMISSFNGAVSFPELQIQPEGEWIEAFRSRWSRNILTNDKCRQCRTAYICGQGSAFSSYLQHGDFQHTPALHCEYCHTMLEYILTKTSRELLKQREIPYGYTVTKEDMMDVFPKLFEPYEAKPVSE